MRGAGSTWPWARRNSCSAELVRLLHLSSRQIIRHQPPQHRKELRGVADLLTQLPGAGVGVCYVGGALPLDRHQRRDPAPPGGPTPGANVSGVSGRVVSDGQTLRQLRHRFHMRRALQGALARALPIGHGLRLTPASV